MSSIQYAVPMALKVALPQERKEIPQGSSERYEEWHALRKKFKSEVGADQEPSEELIADLERMLRKHGYACSVQSIIDFGNSHYQEVQFVLTEH
jgi:hypothetical protein